MEFENTGKYIRVINNVLVHPGVNEFNAEQSELVQAGIKNGLAGGEVKPVQVKVDRSKNVKTTEISKLNAKDTIKLIKTAGEDILKQITDFELAKTNKNDQRKSVLDAVESRLAELHS